MDICITLALVQFIIVFVTDYSGFTENFLKPFFKKVFKTPGEPSKIFVCSLCQQTWIGLLYLLISGNFTIPLFAYNFLLAGLTPVTLSAINLVKDAGEALITFIYKLLNI